MQELFLALVIQMPRVIMLGFSLYCCVSHRCCTADYRDYTDNHNLRRYVCTSSTCNGHHHSVRLPAIEVSRVVILPGASSFRCLLPCYPLNWSYALFQWQLFIYEWPVQDLLSATSEFLTSQQMLHKTNLKDIVRSQMLSLLAEEVIIKSSCDVHMTQFIHI